MSNGLFFAEGRFQCNFCQSLLFSSLWSLWLFRNDITFNTCTPNWGFSSWINAVEPAFPYSGSQLVFSLMGAKDWESRRKSPVNVVWKAPAASSVKWNVYASPMDWWRPPYNFRNFETIKESDSTIQLVGSWVKWRMALEEISELAATQLPFISFSPISRTGNQVVDGLAKSAVERTSDFVAWL
ncbi:conserved hypothetical protein [Ricinus communis]|uniref:Uncharacterized protein n=1 Tax=Ricinus communis TaxID=3988 RepID=B9S7U7_RICCO|nr:conserved hypothetical protein [Ricinus communis]